MGQTRIFRDRVVSMEQTLEGGEKSLDLLKELCREAFPDFQYREHSLDHERDLFVLSFEAADGRRKTVAWTRMVLFDAERIPSLVDNPATDLRHRILAFLRSRATRSEIVVTFRHLEEGWKETPEARPSRRRRRKGGRAEPRTGRPSERGAARPAGSRPTPTAGSRPTPSPGADRRSGGAAPAPAAETARAPGAARRRSRRRRRGRGGGGPGPTPASS